MSKKEKKIKKGKFLNVFKGGVLKFKKKASKNWRVESSDEFTLTETNN